MISKRTIWGVVGGLLAGALAGGCAGIRADDYLAASLTTRAAVVAEAARVVRVIDADTYILLLGLSTFRLRLLGVDTPEHDQAFGPQATDSVTRMLTPGRVVLVAKSGLDLYGRTLGAVLLPTATVAAAGQPVPLDSLLVVRGWAWAYDPNRTVADWAPQQAGGGLWKCGAAEAVLPKFWRSFTAQNKRRYQGTCSW
ncbi:thermonuclease family protein [Hymenobacter sp. PAMC 26628]|uniref:thermonuclease family protein n=1 Tax=Hymenobacter sp. PAMC 26628 TaxID=1484118 RepID=UPI0007700CA7|nr:thermonuclease family protein [Hymenobacter sp. PAMC 26628]AMJ67411.1 hypothetical protein AXW84_19765 [Hymenobacter sp. PAMC 26628]